MCRYISLLITVLVVTSPALPADNWPQFRGPNSTGVIVETENVPPSDWSSEQNIDGKTDMPERRWSSPVVWGKILCLNEVGVTFVTKPGEKFEVLGTNELADDDMGMATPAIVGNRLLIRTAARLNCVKELGE